MRGFGYGLLIRNTYRQEPNQKTEKYDRNHELSEILFETSGEMRKAPQYAGLFSG
jgi:hypothetical protein